MDMESIRRLVGEVSAEDLRYVDCFPGDKAALFMPSCGACFYALTPRHSHPSYMFVLALNDATDISVGRTIIRGEPGRLFALSPGIEHHELPSDSPPRYIAILVDRDFFESRLSEYPVKRDAVFRGEYYDVRGDLLPILKRFMAEAADRPPGCRDMLVALSSEICHSIIRGMFGISPRGDRISARIEVDRAIEHMHANLSEKITLQDMARVAGMSPSHFSRVFKREAGEPPVQYLSRIRMERARRLLSSGDGSITEIALSCGFGSPAYLAGRFAKKFGLSPREFRESLGKSQISKKRDRILKA